MAEIKGPFYLVPCRELACPFTESFMDFGQSYAGIFNEIGEGGSFVLLCVTAGGMGDFNQLPEAVLMNCIGQECILRKINVMPDGRVRCVVTSHYFAHIADVSSTTSIISTEESLREYRKTSKINTIEYTDASDTAMQMNQFGRLRDVLKMHKGRMDAVAPGLISGALESGNLLKLCFATLISNEVPGKDIAEKFAPITSLKTLSDKVLLFVSDRLESEGIAHGIHAEVREELQRDNRIYFLNREIHKLQDMVHTLREDSDKKGYKTDEFEAPVEEDEASQFLKQLAESGMPEDAAEKCRNEIRKLTLSVNTEAGMIRNYIENMLSLPWNKRTEIKDDLRYAENVLNEDHYGLEKVKERILEYLAVQGRADRLHTPIICLVGPPGVGKTSLGRSIARATDRKYVRLALGGIYDESEIRGFSRGYVGSHMGKILQTLVKSGVKNPLFLLDEIDKVSTSSMHGDPSAALLEVLDPEQNSTFMDTYLGVNFDLSEVMFIATANSFDIPAPLFDRMEIIQLGSYTEEEKLEVAKQHLLPKQLKQNGIKDGEVTISDNVLKELIHYYTREAGVRSLDRNIAHLLQKAVKEIRLSETPNAKVRIDTKKLEKYLGPKRYDSASKEHPDRVGIVNGLAYTSFGGDVLTIEAVALPGKGKQLFTGKLGDVMKESIAAAVTVVRARADKIGFKAEVMEKTDLHIHCPEGAVPKDGPSAGISMCTVIASVLSGRKIRGDIAMTGEITLRGDVLPIGGLKEKLFAAMQNGIKKVLIPASNEKDLVEVPKNIRQALEIVPVKTVEEVFKEALMEPEAKETAVSQASEKGKEVPKPNKAVKASSEKKVGEDVEAKKATKTSALKKGSKTVATKKSTKPVKTRRKAPSEPKETK